MAGGSGDAGGVRAADQRGLSMSVLVLFWILALLLITGLVVDGGQQATAARRAESVAAGAARAAADAGAAGRLAGRPDPGAARLAADRYLAASAPVRGSVSVDAGVVTVRTRSEAPTIFLSLIGIARVGAQADASADLVRGDTG